MTGSRAFSPRVQVPDSMRLFDKKNTYRGSMGNAEASGADKFYAVAKQLTDKV